MSGPRSKTFSWKILCINYTERERQFSLQSIHLSISILCYLLKGKTDKDEIKVFFSFIVSGDVKLLQFLLFYARNCLILLSTTLIITSDSIIRDCFFRVVTCCFLLFHMEAIKKQAARLREQVAKQQQVSCLSSFSLCFYYYYYCYCF